MSTAPLLLTACDDPPQEVGVYRNVADCVAGGMFTEPECKLQIADIQQNYLAEAPKFATREECEAANGPEACQSVSVADAAPVGSGQQASSGMGGMWMPLLAGYMMGRMGGGAISQPMYPGRQAGSFRAATGQEMAAGNQRISGAQAASLTSAKSSAVTRGGFGSRMSGSASA